MKIILQERVLHLGNKWEIKDVAPGYARNFLFPKELARPATRALIARAQEEQKKAGERAAQRHEALKAQIAKLEGSAVHISAKADEGGTLFGSVDAKDIALALRGRGIDMGEEAFTIAESIKTMGEHRVTLAFADGLHATVTIIIERES